MKPQPDPIAPDTEKRAVASAGSSENATLVQLANPVEQKREH
jgi:hypothetical protein